ncbi:MAG: hypothetical protein MI747_22390 [Desulfobacterales bacterium]|nr:hypothetical protein [Desulfobacterales bacterium]
MSNDKKSQLTCKNAWERELRRSTPKESMMQFQWHTRKSHHSKMDVPSGDTKKSHGKGRREKPGKAMEKTNPERT